MPTPDKSARISQWKSCIDHRMPRAMWVIQPGWVSCRSVRLMGNLTRSHTGRLNVQSVAHDLVTPLANDDRADFESLVMSTADAAVGGGRDQPDGRCMTA